MSDIDSELVRIADVFASIDPARVDFELDALRKIVRDLGTRFDAFTSDPRAFVQRTKDGLEVKDPQAYKIYTDLAGLLTTTIVQLRKIQADSVRVTEAIKAALRVYGQQTSSGLFEDAATWLEALSRVEAMLRGGQRNGLTPAQVTQLLAEISSLRERVASARLNWRNLFVQAFDAALERAFSELPK